MQAVDISKSLNLYLHIPFCTQKCRYCAFYSIIGSEAMRQRYVEAMLQEIRFSGQKYRDYKVESIYFGGGTPTLLSAAEISTLTAALYDHFRITSGAEFSIEANPESVTQEKLALYKGLGINRISLGLQAWQDELLLAMNRAHTRDEFIKVYTLCREEGFLNINVDLIFGYPKQTHSQWRETVKQVINLKPEHISCYSLEISNQSYLSNQISHGTSRMPSDEMDRDMYHSADHLLTRSGYVHYEISNFALPGFGCRHTTNFWQHQNYLGIGAAAHSYINQVHFHHPENMSDYCQDPTAVIADMKLDQEQLKLEWVLLRLRLISGFLLTDYETSFNSRFTTDFDRSVNELCMNHLIAVKDGWVRCTPRGLDVYDYVIERLAVMTGKS